MIKSIGLCLGFSAMLITSALSKEVCEGILPSDDYTVAIMRSEKSISEEETKLIAKCLYTECRGESLECQKGVCSVIYNRYQYCSYETINDVIYAKSQFDTSGFDELSDEKVESMIEIVEEIFSDGPTMPPHVIYFRADYYHEFSDASNYRCLDNTYFSYSNKLMDKHFGGNRVDTN